MQKRILSFILCAVLICGLFPTTAMAMDSQAEYTGVCTHGSHEGYTELTSEYLTTHNDRLNSGKYYLSGDLNYSGSWYLDVAKNATVELCLNGHTLTFSNEYLLVLDDASLLLENGKVKFSSSAEKVIWGYNSKAVEIRNCDIDGNGTATYLVFINGDTGAQEVKITDSKLHNICDSSYAAVSMFGENPLGSLDISRTDIYDLAGSSNGIYLDCATAKISNCTLDGGGIVNSLAHISEVSNVSITKNGIGLRNDGTIDIIKNCTIVSDGASIQNEGLIKEISGGSYTYNPTREQLAAILWRYAQHKKCDVSVGEDTNILSYADALTVSEWAVPAMQWANGAGLIQGSDNNLMPKGNATRAQAAAILHRFCEPVTGE